MKPSAWAILLALALSWGAYVIGKEVGHFEAAAATKARWKAEAESMQPPASSPSKRW